MRSPLKRTKMMDQWDQAVAAWAVRFIEIEDSLKFWESRNDEKMVASLRRDCNIVREALTSAVSHRQMSYSLQRKRQDEEERKEAKLQKPSRRS